MSLANGTPNAAANENAIKFCPKCGAGAALADTRKIVCGTCGFRLYINTAAAVAGLITDADGRVMLIRRNRDPQKGLLDLPGGFVDFGEDAKTALAREAREELGIAVGDVAFYRSMPNVYEYAGFVYNTLDLFFTCRADARDLQNITPNDEIAEILYRHPRDISEDEIAFPSMKKIFRDLRG